MIKNLLGYFMTYMAGILTSLFANYIWAWYEKRGWRRLKRFLPRISKQLQYNKPEHGFLKAGKTTVPWVVCSYGPYTPENIEIFYNPNEIKRPPEIRQLYQELVKDIRKKEIKGESVPFNGLGYQLEKFFVDYRRGEHEEPVLKLYFRPTDYFTMLVTDNRLDESIIVNNTKTTLRQKYASYIDLAYSPVLEFATHFGVGIMIITSDEKIIFSERGPTAVDSFVFFPSVAEGSNRPADALHNGGPDPYRTAVRGIAEEMGIDVKPEQVKFLSIGANAVLCEYALCGVVYTDYSSGELSEIRSLGIPKDRWENQRLHFVTFSPSAVADFMAANKPWSPFAVACTVHALYDAFGPQRIIEAFRNIKIELSQKLPKEFQFIEGA
jgi:hypothetical protein